VCVCARASVVPSCALQRSERQSDTSVRVVRDCRVYTRRVRGTHSERSVTAIDRSPCPVCRDRSSPDRWPRVVDATRSIAPAPVFTASTDEIESRAVPREDRPRTAAARPRWRLRRDLNPRRDPKDPPADRPARRVLRFGASPNDARPAWRVIRCFDGDRRLTAAIYDATAATMNVPIVAGDVVDDGGFERPRFVRVSWYRWVPIEFHGPATSNSTNLPHARARRTSGMTRVSFAFDGASYDNTDPIPTGFRIVDETRVDLDTFSPIRRTIALSKCPCGTFTFASIWLMHSGSRLPLPPLTALSFTRVCIPTCHIYMHSIPRWKQTWSEERAVWNKREEGTAIVIFRM